MFIKSSIVKSFIFIFFLSINILIAQTNVKVVTGFVFDAQTSEPLPFANIMVSRTKTGATTNEDGKFSLSNISVNDEIIVSYVGYKSSSIKIENSDFKNLVYISLQPININLQEVTVYANTLTTSDKIQASSLSIQSERIREIAVGMPDILRSVQSLPGIATNNELKAEFNVRGGNQDENLVLVNGTQVYEPYHIKEAANASVGIFNVDLMKKVNIITGGFSAKYGDKMSSVLDIEYRQGSKEKYSGAASLSLAYLDGYVEGPLGEKGSFILGARKSYMEYILSLIDFEDISKAQPSFYDLQGVLAYNLTPRNKLLFEFIHAGDDFSYDPHRDYTNKVEDENNLANYGSTLFDIKSKNILSSKALLNVEVNYYDQTDKEYRLFLRDDKNRNYHLERLTYDSLQIRTLQFSTDLQYQFNPSYEIQTGLSYKNIVYDQISDDIWTIDNNPPYQGAYGSGQINANSYKYDAYVENIFSVSDALTLNIGGRLDYFDINKDFTLSPRVNLAYAFNDGTVIKAAWGNFYQSPIYHQLKYSEASDSNTQSQMATHFILGVDKSFFFSNKNNSYFKLKVEGYYKKYDDLISSWYGVFERLTYSKKNDAVGTAKGIDVYAVLSLPGFYSWISYGLLSADEEVLDSKSDIFGKHPRYTDQRHTISFVSNIEMGNKWRFSLKAYYGSGFPYTPKTAVKNAQGIWVWKSGNIHSNSLPAYKRLDIRISKLFVFDNFSISTFVDVSNVLNFKNIQQFEYSSIPDFDKPKPEEILLWPILPTFGIRFQF
ncbi:MAG: TonB-dependent receptor [Melioribacteraceae bacterium]